MKMPMPDSGAVDPKEEIKGLKRLELIAGRPNVPGEDRESILKQFHNILKEDREAQEEAGAAHFKDIDFNDLEKEDIGAYVRFREPLKKFEGMTADELLADIEHRPELYEQLDDIYHEFTVAHRELQNELKNEPDKKKAQSRGDFWAFIANKISPVYTARQMYKIKLKAGKKK
jgi:hypothetical protein